MKVVVQRVLESSVKVEGKIVGKIDNGYMLLVSFTYGDNIEKIDYMIKKILNLRIFDDDNGIMNKSILDVQGSVLSISQFTLYADCKKGRRPSFLAAAKPQISKPLYEKFNKMIEDEGIHVETGVFGAMMNVKLINSGPTTIILDSDEIM